MAKMKYCNPKTMASPGGHYSHVVVANGMAFISGQLPITAAGQQLNSASFEDQAKQVLINLQAALEAANSSIENLVQVRVYITNINYWPLFNTIYAQWADTALPARAVVPVPELHHGFLIEIEALALV